MLCTSIDTAQDPVYARHVAMYLMYVISLNPRQLCEANVIIPISLMRKLKSGEVKPPIQLVSRHPKIATQVCLTSEPALTHYGITFNNPT